uniref:Uncharacterized protein n=1 Tax=Capra hircus TaxID=9925 RepID=A0A8C2XUC5_CAPHI
MPSPNYGRLVIENFLLLSLFRTWDKRWLNLQLAHASLFNLQCIISPFIVPHCFQGKRVLTFQLNLEMLGIVFRPRHLACILILGLVAFVEYFAQTRNSPALTLCQGGHRHLIVMNYSIV